MNLLHFTQLLFLFLIGASIGSFLNVVIDRFATNRSIIKGRSYCESCKKTLETRDLIPLISFLLLKGKCRYCSKKISARLFLVELITGILFVFIFFTYSFLSIHELGLVYVILSLFIAIFFIDLEYGIIPDKLTVLLTIFSGVYTAISGVDIANHFLSGAGSLLFFIGLYVVTRGKGMGLGDVKLSFALGVLLGFPLIIYGLYLAFLTGAVVSIILVLWKKKNFRTGTVPFGPFLTASTLFAFFLGNTLIIPFVNLIF